MIYFYDCVAHIDCAHVKETLPENKLQHVERYNTIYHGAGKAFATIIGAATYPFKTAYTIYTEDSTASADSSPSNE